MEGCRSDCFTEIKGDTHTVLMNDGPLPGFEKFQEPLRSDEGQKAMRKDGLKVETMRMLVEFTP